MTVDHLAAYKTLLERYYSMVFNGQWWDGQRDRLVAEMDRVWERLSLRQRDRALEYAHELYLKEARS